MKNKAVILLILTFALSFSLQAQVKKYAFGDSIFVWATSLNMRESPDAGAKIVCKVPYGAVVVVVDSEIGKVNYRYKAVAEYTAIDTLTDYEERKTDQNTTISSPKFRINKQKFPAYYLSGYWVKVDFKGRTGYVFDAYLSKLTPIPSFTDGDNWGAVHRWGQKSLHLKTSIKKEIDCEIFSCKSAQSPIEIIWGCNGVSCSFTTIKIKDGNFEEGVMLAIQIFGAAYVWDSDKEHIRFADEKESNNPCGLNISSERGFIIIQMECCC